MRNLLYHCYSVDLSTNFVLLLHEALKSKVCSILPFSGYIAALIRSLPSPELSGELQ